MTKARMAQVVVWVLYGFPVTLHRHMLEHARRITRKNKKECVQALFDTATQIAEASPHDVANCPIITL